VQDRAREMVTARGEAPPLLFAASSDFPHGVVGLAASRLLDEFYRPAVVVSIEDEWSKGSARSIPEFHITEALDTMGDVLARYGGHSAAAGFTVPTDRLPEVEARLLALACEQLAGLTLAPTLQVDAETPLETLSWDLYHAMERLEPFGYGNAVPVLVSRNARVIDGRAVGADGRHLKLRLADDHGVVWDAIAFRQGDWIRRLPCRIDLAYMLEANVWNERVNLQLNVQDIHFPGEE
jgi:single-stranded-DNA-specific exonuclease